MQVQFFFEHRSISLKDRNNLKKFVAKIFEAERKPFSHLNYIFCTDERLLKINQEYLNHDYYTDIITFQLSDTGEPIAGEIYISIDRVRENARSHNVTIQDELHRVIFHGALHLCGYRDKSGKDKRVMQSAENLYLKQYFI